MGEVQRYLDADNHQAMKTLQGEIEAGLYVAVAGPAEVRGSETRLPLWVPDEEAITTPNERRYTRQFHG